MPPEFKIPESVLVVIHTAELEVLLLERADHPGFWQSVTGSRNSLAEPLAQTAMREVGEETGIHAPQDAFTNWQHTNRYAIYPHWRHRYAPGVTENTEHVFSLCVPRDIAIALAPREHLRYLWMDWESAADHVFSWTNAKAIRALPALIQRANRN
ncbi:MAG: dihydroneopterin triphosphate diphosphatase [Burkholderiaceae bacterium]